MRPFNAREFRKKNDAERLWYTHYWAAYVTSHHDKDWSKQQNIFINSIMQNCKHPVLTPQQYLKIKGEKCFRD